MKKEAALLFKLLKKLFSLRLFRIFLITFLLILLSPFLLFYFLRPHEAKNINYGVTFSSKYAEDIGLNWKEAYIKILDDLKVKNIRLVVYWDEAEKYQNWFDYSNIKWQLDEAQKRNLNVILTMGKKVPRYPECFEPDWVKSSPNQSFRDRSLYQYLSKTTQELKNYSVIKIWQVENEPFWPFGVCEKTDKNTVEKEIALVRKTDPSRPILVQDSGEGGFWFPTYKLGDYLGISMYRKIWYDFWGFFMKKFIYFQYPLANWTYKIKANLVGVPVDKIMVTELQAEPWGPSINSQLSEDEKDKTMSRTDFISTLNYAQKTGFKDFYLWGVEWWLFEKESRNNSFYWDTAKALFQ